MNSVDSRNEQHINYIRVNFNVKNQCFLFFVQAQLKFPPDYPYSPPSMRFVTKVWHPNVYEVGFTFFIKMFLKLNHTISASEWRFVHFNPSPTSG